MNPTGCRRIWSMSPLSLTPWLHPDRRSWIRLNSGPWTNLSIVAWYPTCLSGFNRMLCVVTITVYLLIKEGKEMSNFLRKTTTLAISPAYNFRSKRFNMRFKLLYHIYIIIDHYILRLIFSSWFVVFAFHGSWLVMICLPLSRKPVSAFHWLKTGKDWWKHWTWRSELGVEDCVEPADPLSGLN